MGLEPNCPVDLVNALYHNAPVALSVPVELTAARRDPDLLLILIEVRSAVT